LVHPVVSINPSISIPKRQPDSAAFPVPIAPALGNTGVAIEVVCVVILRR